MSINPRKILCMSVWLSSVLLSQGSWYSSGLVNENPSKTSGSIALMTVGSTGERRQGSLVNSGSKLFTDFLLRCRGINRGFDQ